MESVLAFASVVISLVIMESLLSVDNAMVIGALASELPKHQQKKALWYGLAGAYLFRGLALFVASWLASSPILHILGSAYLIYAMCKHLAKDHHADAHHAKPASFWGTVLVIELTDVVFAIDNVIAAVALSKDFWAIFAGVAIGIASMRLITGYVLVIIEKAPILKSASFLLLGVVGGFMLIEHFGHVHIGEIGKLFWILGTLAACVAYGQSALLQRLLKPLVTAGLFVMWIVATVIDYPFSLASRVISGFRSQTK